MFKLRFMLCALCVLLSGFAYAQPSHPTRFPCYHDPQMRYQGQPSTGANGIARLDLRIADQSGTPLRGAYAELESKQRNNHKCWVHTWSCVHGDALLPPIRTGVFQLTVKLAGYRTLVRNISEDDLSRPLTVQLERVS